MIQRSITPINPVPYLNKSDSFLFLFSFASISCNSSSVLSFPIFPSILLISSVVTITATFFKSQVNVEVFTNLGLIKPLLNSKPFTNSVYVSPVLEFDSITIPFSPILAYASATIPPIYSSLLADIVATCLIISGVLHSIAFSLTWVIICSTAKSIPLFSKFGLAPCSKYFSASSIIAHAKIVEALVPSPQLVTVSCAACFIM